MNETIYTQIKDAVAERLGDGFEVSLCEVTRNNNLKFNTLTIHKPGEQASPNIYFDQYIDAFDGEVPAVVDEVVRAYRNYKDPDIDFISHLSKETILQKAGKRLINAEKNAEFLKTVPHKLFLDLAVTYSIELDIDDDRFGTIIVTDAMCNAYDVTLDELEAATNKKQNDFQIVTISSVLNEAGVMDALCDTLPMHVITNSRKSYGASAMTYAAVLGELASRINDDLYILPSSVHEIITVPAGFGNLDKLKRMVPEINAAEISADEFLSDQVYKYSRETGTVEIAA